MASGFRRTPRGTAFANSVTKPEEGCRHMRNALLAGMVVLGLATPPLLASSPDEMFVLDVAKDGMAEVELGKLAADKGSRDEVKKFGQRMADDHSKANDRSEEHTSELQSLTK